MLSFLLSDENLSLYCGFAYTFLFCFLQIDVFEQQFRSISKIDFMEKFINEVKTKQNKDTLGSLVGGN